MNHAFSKIWIVVVVVLLITGGILACPPKFLKEKFERAWQYFGVPEEEVTAPEEKITEIAEDETANRKTYRNEEYGFEIKYPPDWMKEDICDSDPFCLSFTEYETLPTEEEYFLSPTICVLPCTKEDFIRFKNYLENNILPPAFVEGRWKFIKVGGRNAIQSLIGYNVPSGSYDIETALFAKDVFISLNVNLPIRPYLKEELAPDGYPQVDIEKSIKREEELNRGIFPNKEVEKVISEYQTMLSTFRFLE